MFQDTKKMIRQEKAKYFKIYMLGWIGRNSREDPIKCVDGDMIKNKTKLLNGIWIKWCYWTICSFESINGFCKYMLQCRSCRSKLCGFMSIFLWCFSPSRVL